MHPMLQVLQTLAFATPLAERLYPTFGGLMRHPGLEKMWMADVVPKPGPLFLLASGITDFILNASGRHAGADQNSGISGASTEVT
jgi:hypothetical protein